VHNPRRDRRRQALPARPPARARRRPDPVVRDSANKQRRGRLPKQGSPHLRWLVEAAQHACRQTSPDHQLYRRQRGHAGANPTTLTIAHKIAKRALHILRELEASAAA
jgi:transposase